MAAKAVVNVLLVLTTLVVVPAKMVGASTYNVGDDQGWSQSVDYASWAAGKTFAVGDTLVFKYGSSHSVDQVSKADYDACNTGSSIKSYTGGSNSIKLTAAGPIYFICPRLDHCATGMKVAINVAAASANTPATGSSTPAPPPPNGASGVFGGTVNLVVGVLLVAVGQWMI